VDVCFQNVSGQRPLKVFGLQLGGGYGALSPTPNVFHMRNFTALTLALNIHQDGTFEPAQLMACFLSRVLSRDRAADFLFDDEESVEHDEKEDDEECVEHDEKEDHAPMFQAVLEILSKDDDE